MLCFLNQKCGGGRGKYPKIKGLIVEIQVFVNGCSIFSGFKDKGDADKYLSIIIRYF